MAVERACPDLARRLEVECGRGFSEKNLRRMVQFAEAFPDPRIVATLSRQLSWSQFVVILPVKNAQAREFYAEMELYLRWLDRHDRLTGERPPLGLILCAGKSDEHLELLEVKRSGICVAQYLGELPSLQTLRDRLRRLVRAARERRDAWVARGESRRGRTVAAHDPGRAVPGAAHR